MSGNETLHIEVTYKIDKAEITRTYAISQETLREAQILRRNATDHAVKEFLESRGCHLDSDNGPAHVEVQPDGSRVEEYFRKGKHHREGGPACTERKADGSTDQAYFRDGKLHRQDGPARIIGRADGSTYEGYFQDGTFVRSESSPPHPSTPSVPVQPGNKPAAPAP